jgi:chemotaxis methyl-accepting protein methylase
MLRNPSVSAPPSVLVMPELFTRLLAERLRELVFRISQNVLDPSRVIFLRNVMLYFSQETRRALLSGIHCLLAPDGVLFLGSAEQPTDPSIWNAVLAGGTCYFRPRSTV